MISQHLQEQVSALYDASEARQIRILPGRIRASGRPAAIVVATQYRGTAEGRTLFVTPLGTLIGAALVTADGLEVTQAADDAFDELLMYLRNESFEPLLYATKDGHTVVTFTSQRTSGRSRPLLTLPWWDSTQLFRATGAGLY